MERNAKKKKISRKLRLRGLMEVYPGLLTIKERQVLELYTKPNVSGSDVARKLKISRQAVHDHIKRALDRMESCEERVKFLKKRSRRRMDIQKLYDAIKRIAEENPTLEKECEEIDKIVQHIDKNS